MNGEGYFNSKLRVNDWFQLTTVEHINFRAIVNQNPNKRLVMAFLVHCAKLS